MSRRAVDGIAAYAGAHVHLPALMFSAVPVDRIKATSRCRTTPRNAGRSTYTTRKLSKLASNLLINYSSLPLARGDAVASSSASPVSPTRHGSRSACSLHGSPITGWPTVVVLVAFLSGNIMLSLGVLGGIHRPARAGEFAARAIPGLRGNWVNGSAGGEPANERAPRLLVAFVAGNVSLQLLAAKLVRTPPRCRLRARSRWRLLLGIVLHWPRPGSWSGAKCTALSAQPPPTRRTRCSSRWSWCSPGSARRSRRRTWRAGCSGPSGSCCACSAKSGRGAGSMTSWIALALLPAVQPSGAVILQGLITLRRQYVARMAPPCRRGCWPSTMLAVRGFGVGGSTSPQP